MGILFSFISRMMALALSAVGGWVAVTEGKPFHKGEEPRGVIASFGEVEESRAVSVSLRFLSHSVRDGSHEEVAGNQHFPRVLGAGEQSPNDEGKGDGFQSASLFCDDDKVSVGGVGDFVGENPRKFIIALSEFNKPLMDVNKTAGDRESIDVFIRDHLEDIFILVVRGVSEGSTEMMGIGDFSNFLADALDAFQKRRVLG
jgi:hypothetical protein